MHYGTHAQRCFAQVGNLHVGLEGAHSARLIFAHDKLQVVAAGREKKAGVVLHVFAAHLPRAIERELHGVALVAYGEFSVGAHFADDVDRGVGLFLFRARTEFAFRESPAKRKDSSANHPAGNTAAPA